MGVVLLVIIGGGWMAAHYMGSMPGKSWRGALPPLSDSQRQLSARLRAHVEYLASTIGERNTGKPRALEAAAVYIEHALSVDGLTTSVQHYQCVGLDVRNIIAERRGASAANEIVVIGAHYDSAPGTPGANDNASGVAATLELARYFAEVLPERTIRFVAFVNEEPPYFQSNLMGSMVYAKACRGRGDRIVAMLTPETVGYYSDRRGSQQYPYPFKLAFPSAGNFIAFIGNNASRDLLRRSVGAFRSSVAFPSEGAFAPESIQGIGWSDHWSFWQAGYPGIMVTDTAPFRYPYYHDPRDTPEKIDYDRLARVVDGLAGTIRELAGVKNENK